MGEEAENSRTGAYVQHHLIPEVCHVGQDGALVGGGADVILHHVLLLREVAVELEILRGGRVLRAGLEDGGLGAGPDLAQHLSELPRLVLLVQSHQDGLHPQVEDDA